MFKIIFFLIMDLAFIIPLIMYWDEAESFMWLFFFIIVFFTFELFYNIRDKFKK